MQFITVIIARLIDGKPMSAEQWISFRYAVIRILREVPAGVGSADSWLEISSGLTAWKGRSELCMTATLMNVSHSLMAVIKENLRDLPARYGQDAIGIRYGTAELITPHD